MSEEAKKTAPAQEAEQPETAPEEKAQQAAPEQEPAAEAADPKDDKKTVSYTHLTLPTILLV